MRLHKIIKIALGAQLSAQKKNLRRAYRRIETDKILAALPEKAVVQKQFVDLEDLTFIDMQALKRHLQPALLDIMRIEIHRDQDYIGQIRRALAEKEQLLVIYPVKGQPPI